MKKLFQLLAALMVFAFAATAMAGTLEEIQKRGKLRVGMEPGYMPFELQNKKGEIIGFDADMAATMAKAMGVKLELVSTAWDGIIPALLAKQIDMVDSGMSITAERAKVVQFSNPYWTVSRVFVVPADSKLTPADILSKKIQLGVQRGTSEANDIKKEQEEKKYPFELRFYESSPLAVEDLLNGRIQAALMDELPANNAIENGRAVKKAGTHGEPDNFGVAMRKDDKELQKLVNEGYKKLMADPYWKELQQKYLSK